MALWNPPESRRPGILRLVFDSLLARYFEPVFWPERENEYGYDLTKPYGGEERLRSAQAQFGDPVAIQGTAGDLLSALSDLSIDG